MRLEDYEEYMTWVNGVKKSSAYQYKTTMRLYHKFTGMTPKQLIDEAEEELQKPRRERGKPQERLIEFYKYLVNEYQPKKGKNAKKGKPGLSPYRARNRVGSLRSFYKANGYPITTLKLPKVAPKKENQRVEFSIKDIRALVETAPTWRDKTLILFGFQGGFDVDTVVKLTLGDFHDRDLKKLLKNETPRTPLLLPVVREKEGIDYHTCLGHDAVDAFRAYLQERKARGEELTLDSPAFVKEGSRKYSGGRIDRPLVHHLMREVVVKARVVSKERLERADFNIAGYHALRSTFSRRMEYSGFPTAYIDYCQGHTLPHGGAYRRPNPRKLLEKYKEHEEALSISKAPRSYQEVEEKLKKEIQKKDYQIEGMEQRIKNMEEKLKGLESLGNVESEIMELVEMVRERKRKA